MRTAQQTARQPSKGSCGCKAGPAEPCRCSVKTVPNPLGSALSLARRSSGGSPSRVPASVGAVLRSPGVPLPSSVRSDFESRFSHDFSRVRIHADGIAARSARQAGALAYTVGRHIAFGDGQYSPNSARGRDTLAHELAHVVQQRAVADGQVPTSFSAAGEEREADSHASSALAGRKLAIPPARPANLARLIVQEGTYTHPPDPEVRVHREIEEGRCTWYDEGGSASGVDLRHAWLSFTVCRGSTRGSGDIDVEYGTAIGQAMNAVNIFLSNPLAPGAGNTLRQNLEQLGPNISARFELSMGPALAALTGFAHIDARGRVTGSGGPSVRVNVGQDELEIGAIISGGTGQPTSVMFPLTWRFGGARTVDDCGVCECTKPNITNTCTELPPPTGSTPPPRPPPVAIPINFEYSRTTLQPGMDARVARIVSLIEQGYTVSRIVGSTSPEGDELLPEERGPDRFAGNIPLSQRRANTARDLVQAEVTRRLTGGRASVLRPDHPSLRNLRNAFTGNPPVIGTSELFGSSAAGEVPRRQLFRHLTTVLRAPDPGERDPLEGAGVIGGDLPADIDTAARGEVDAFRTGVRGRRRLGRRARLNALYHLLRRALVELAPPQIDIRAETDRIIREQNDRELARTAAGRAIPCEARHLDILPSLRTLRLHTGNCGPATAPLDETQRRGQRAP